MSESTMKFPTKVSSKKIPRPMNSFMIYRFEKQREIVKECPGTNHRDISKIIAQWWKEMSEKEKEPYRKEAERVKEEHFKLYPNYRYSPQRRLKKTRAYKKRKSIELNSVEYFNRKQLEQVYHRGRPSKETTPDIMYSTDQNEKEMYYLPMLPPCSEIDRQSLTEPLDIMNDFCDLDSLSYCKSLYSSSYCLPPNHVCIYGNKRYMCSTRNDLPEDPSIYTRNSLCCYEKYDTYLNNRWNRPLAEYEDSPESLTLTFTNSFIPSVPF